MTIHVFKLPDIGEGTAEAELVAWHVQVGDVVDEDQPVADIMTDKATVELTSPVAGRILALHGAVGASSQVGAPFIEFEVGDGDADGRMDAADSIDESHHEPNASGGSPSAQTVNHDAEPILRPKASPLVRRRAKELGIALEDLTASAPYNRIRSRDLDAYLAYRSQAPSIDLPSATNPTPQGGQLEFEDVKLVGLRRRIAERMEISTRQIPHFSYVEEADVTELEATRVLFNTRYGNERPKLSFLPFFILAICRTLPGFPHINATYDEPNGTVRRYRPVHVGIATQTDSGLMVPVVRDAQSLGLWELAAEVSRVAAAARDGTAKRDELSGSSITITSLGTLGAVVTTPVINHPEVAIVGPNKIIDRPVVKDGTVQIRKMMNISSSFDHRVVDGYDAALFVQEIKQLIEEPRLLLAR